MKHKDKIKEKFIHGIRFLQNRIAELVTADSHRRQVGEALHESEVQKNAILNGISTNIAFVDKDLKIIWANKTAAESVNKSPEEMIGRACHEFWADPLKPCKDCPTLKAFQTKKPEHTIINTPDGRVWDEGGEPVFDANGNVIGVVQIAHDITDRKKAENALGDSAKCLKSVMDSIDSLVYVADFNSYEVLLINKYGRELWGDVQGRKCWEVIQKDQKGPCAFCTNDKLVSSSGKSTGVYSWEFQNTITGRWYECRDQAISWVGKTLVRMEIATDITERKKLQDTLNKSEEKLRNIVATVPGAMYQFYGRKDGSMGMSYLSDQAEKIIGAKIDLESFVEKFIAMVVPEQRESFVRSIQKAVKEISEWKFEWMMKKPTGELIWLSANSIPYIEGDDIIFSGIFQDITERKRQEEELVYFQKAVESATDAIGMSTPEGKHYYQNEAFTKLFGLSVDEVSGFSGPPVSVYADEKAGHEIFDAIMGGGSWAGEVKMCTKDKTEKDIFLRAYSVKNNEGKIIALVGIHTDITERKHAINSLIQSEKLASLGRLVSEIAHEVNNPLMVISGNAELSLVSKPLSVEVKKNLQIIVEASQRAKNITERLLKFSKPSKGAIKEVNINESLEAIVRILEQQFKTVNVKIKREYGDNLSAIPIDEQLMQEVFMNLIRNAKEAMPGGGVVTIKTYSDGDYLRIDFKDTGSGMSEDAKKKMFEPFFTTKKDGTGLGLAICYGIISAHKGELKFESQSNEGTVATITLPWMGGEGVRL